MKLFLNEVNKMAMVLPAAAEALPMIIEGLGNLGNVATAGKALYSLGSKYVPNVTSANRKFSRGRKSAQRYIKGLTSAKGLHKLIARDIPKALRKSSKYIASGKGLKLAQGLGDDLGQAISLVEGVTGSNQYTDSARQIHASGLQKLNTGNDILSKYNTTAREFGSLGVKV